jgi:UDP-glucose:(glucosyl)LPS alpha-1,2-glucosyltransferase
MSVVYKGKVIDSNLTKNARGGTEQMRSRLIKNVDKSLLEKFAIHFSRPEKLYDDVLNILYCHDLADDSAVSSIAKDMDKYAKFVFVSYWQRDQFINKFNIPYSKCTVIQNAVERTSRKYEKPKDKINVIYHTTPHRGLQLVYPIFDKLCELHDNIHLDVYSSFEVYGWKQRDVSYQLLFDMIKKHPHMTYHGAVSNDEVLKALDKAHIFLYPSIWQETSCIALIEAMVSGVFPIYSSYGALQETGSFTSNVGMYDHTENISEHANAALNIANHVITSQKNNPAFIDTIMSSAVNNSNLYSIEKYTSDWNNLLKSTNERSTINGR